MTLGHVRTVANAANVPGGTVVWKSDFSGILAGRDPSRPPVVRLEKAVRALLARTRPDTPRMGNRAQSDDARPFTRERPRDSRRRRRR